MNTKGKSPKRSNHNGGAEHCDEIIGTSSFRRRPERNDQWVISTFKMKMLAWLFTKDIVLWPLQVKWTRTRMDTSILKSLLSFASNTLHSIYLLTKFVLIHGAPFLKYCWMFLLTQPLKCFNDFGNTLAWNAIITCWNPNSIYYMAFRALQLWELFTRCPKFLPYSASALEALLLRLL